MATPQKNKEHIIKNQTSITYIERELEKIEAQLNEVQTIQQRIELTNYKNSNILKGELHTIDTRLKHLEEKNRDAKLSRHDKTALYAAIAATIGLIIVELIKNIF